MDRSDPPRHRARDSRRRAVTRASRRGLVDGRNDGRRGVAEDERAPRAEEVQIGAAVDVPDPRPLSVRDEERVTADSAERPHGAVDAAGDPEAGGFEETLGVPHQDFFPNSAPIPTL